MPVTVPVAPCAAPRTTVARLPTQAKTLRPRFLSGWGCAMLIDGCTQSADQPNALSPTETLVTIPPKAGQRKGVPSAISR